MKNLPEDWYWKEAGSGTFELILHTWNLCKQDSKIPLENGYIFQRDNCVRNALRALVNTCCYSRRKEFAPLFSSRPPFLQLGMLGSNDNNNKKATKFAFPVKKKNLQRVFIHLQSSEQLLPCNIYNVSRPSGSNKPRR